MPRLLKYLIIYSGLLVFLTGEMPAQSRNAYLQAGDDCLQKQDPYCALVYYRQALDYGDDALVFLRLSETEKALFNYRNAEQWIRKSMMSATTTDLKTEICLKASDLYKRMGDYPTAFRYIDTLLLYLPGQQERWHKLNAAYKTAARYAADSIALQAIPLEGDVNTAYSDFAPTLFKDSILVFSSMRYQIADGKSKTATSRIAALPLNSAGNVKSKLLEETINKISFNDANASISPDGKIMIFTRCMYNDDGKLICSLYESKNENGKWTEASKLPEQINASLSTTTQPCITSNKSLGYLLFFASNRKGGNGGMDIWWTQKTVNGSWQKPENAGMVINSANDEWSPFLDPENGRITFSSERDSGLGGLDLWQTDWPSSTSGLQHLPRPYNSGYNDLYFIRSFGDPVSRLLVSNRPPAQQLNGSSCCYDIFRLKEILVKADTVITIPADSGLMVTSAPDETSDSIRLEQGFLNQTLLEQQNTLSSYLPIRLYFDNDQPDPRTISKTTRQRYDILAENYLEREEDYRKQQGSAQKESAIIAFFQDSVRQNIERLETFSSLLELMLRQYPGRLKITITGSASPLAESRYNVILSNRRIVSLENYWVQKVGGKLKDAIDHLKLVIHFIPAGEAQSAAGVSDDRRDPSNSVYSRDAALERRIELTAIELIP